MKPQPVMAFGALVRDTFREAFARKVFWGFYGLSTLMILFFLFIMQIDVVEGATATVSLFGRDMGRNLDVTKVMQNVFGAVSSFLYGFGLFLAVFASGGLTPSLLEPGRIELLLSKPVARWQILLGRYAGILLVVGANIAYLVLGVWLILSIKTGLWNPLFLTAIGMNLLIFAVMLALVVLIGVLWDSAAVAIMVSVAVMIVSPILAQEKIALRLLSSEWTRQLWTGLYHCLPKIYDLGAMQMNMVRGQAVGSWLPVWTSLAFGVVILGTALWHFERRDF
jgi:ABC-2 type transport system permease protein